MQHIINMGTTALYDFTVLGSVSHYRARGARGVGHHLTNWYSDGGARADVRTSAEVRSRCDMPCDTCIRAVHRPAAVQRPAGWPAARASAPCGTWPLAAYCCIALNAVS